MARSRIWPGILALLLLFQLLGPAIPVHASTPIISAAAKLHAGLGERLLAAAGEHVSFLVLLAEQADTTEPARTLRQQQSASTNPRALTAEVRKSVVQALRASADRTQMQLAGLIAELQAQGHISRVEPLWVVNALAITGDEIAAARLAERAEVASLAPDRTIQRSRPETETVAEAASTVAPAAASLPWNLEMIGAGQAWAAGADGTGVVVGIIDSGVDSTHPALRDRLRPFANWLDLAYSAPQPEDVDGHGTHVTGSILGYDPATAQRTGVAPGAQWIAARVFDAAGYTTDSKLLAAGQWMLAPTDAQGVPHPEWAPDVVNNSWGAVTPGVDEFYRQMVKNWRAAGIVPVFSAGNEGKLGPGSVTAPGNYPESYSVAAVDIYSRLPYFSSRGPSPYGTIIKPNVSAPGVYINSTLPGGGYGSMSGTSMASPHVAGAMAVLLSANPSLSVSQLEELLTRTAAPRTDATYPTSPNYGFGHGIINVGAAVATQSGTLTGVVTNKATGQPIPALVSLAPGPIYTGTRSDGTYTLLAKAGQYTATVFAPTFEMVTQTVTITIGQTTTLDVQLTPKPPGTITGRVTDAASGAAIAGALVTIPELPTLPPATTNASGEYQFSVSAAAYTVTAQAPQYLPRSARVTVASGATVTLDLALDRDTQKLDDWPQARGGAQRTNSNESLIAPPLQKLWTSTVSPASTSTVLPPVVAGDRIFITNVNDRKVYAVSLNNGEVLWSTTAFPYTPTAPSYVQGLVVVATNSSGEVHGIDASSGQILWSKAFYAYGEWQPTVAQGRIYIHPNSTNKTMALDLAGTKVWESSTGGTFSVIADGQVFSVKDYTITALDQATGQLKWTWSSPGSGAQPRGLAYAEGLLLFTTSSTVYAVDTATGKLRWQQSGAYGLPATWDGHAYLPLSGEKVARIRLSDGKLISTFAFGTGSTSAPRFSPVIAGGLLWVSGLRALDPVSGQLVWSYGGDTTAASFPADLPVIAGSRMLILEGGLLTALGPASVPPSGTLSGRLINAATGAPMAYRTIYLEGTRQVARTNRTGDFRILAAPGTHSVRVEAYGYDTLRTTVTVEANQERTLPLALQPTPTGSLTGQITETFTGLAVHGATLSLKEDAQIAPVSATPDGRFQMQAFTGDYTLVVTAPGYLPLELPVHVPAGEAADVPVGMTLARQRPDQWVSEFGQPDHGGVSESFVAPPLQKVWDTGALTMSTSARPAIADGKIFAVASDKTLRAFSLADGRQLWSHPLGYWPDSPAYDRGTVYAVDGYDLFALDANTGGVRWSLPFDADAAPTAAHGRVYVMADDVLYAFDGATGETIWNAPNLRGGGSNPAVSGDVVYVSGGGPFTYAFDAATGRQLWMRAGCSCSSGASQHAVIAGNYLLEIATGTLNAIDLRTGQLRWTRSGHYGTPVVANGLVYANLTIFNASTPETAVLRLEDGVELHRLPVSGKLALAGNYLFSHKLTVVNLTTRKVEATLQSTASSYDTNVAVGEDRVAAINGALYVYKSSNTVPAGLIQGRVVSDGTPYEPIVATVTVGGRTYSTEMKFGAFSARVPTGPATVTVSAPGWQTVTQQVQVLAGQPTPLLVQLQRQTPSRIYGIVTDAVTGLPVEGARIRLAEAGGLPPIVTGADGRYEALPFAGTYTLQVGTPGYRNAAVQVTVNTNDSVLQNLSLIAGPAGDCPTERCGGDRSGVSASAGVPPYTQAWTSHITFSGINVQSHPIVAGGMVFAGGAPGKLTALNLVNGRIIWERSLTVINSAPPQTPAYGNGMLFVTTTGGQVYGLDAATGTTIWQASLSGTGWDVSAPIYDGTRVYTVVADNLYALNPGNGQVLWSKATHSSIGQLALGGGRIYAGSNGPSIKAFDPVTGQELWSVSNATSNEPRLSYAGEVLLATTASTGITAYNATTGGVLWTAAGGYPAVKDGVVYHVASGTLNARDLRTGSILWSMPVTAANPGLEPTVTGNILILGTATAVDLTSRQEVWSISGGKMIPVVAGDGYILMSLDTGYGLLSALKGAAGNRKVTVQVGLEGRTSVAGISVTLTGNSSSYTAVTGADGRAVFSQLLPGTYTVRASHPLYLRRTQPVTVGTTDVTMPAVTLLRGDVNQNGVIDLADLDAILAWWHSTDAAKDLNEDGRVDLVDLFLIQRNLGLSDL